MREADLEIVERLVVELAELPAAERAAGIARACEAYPHLRAEVESLLAAHDRAGASFLQAFTPAPLSALLDLPVQHPGDIVGSFRLIEPIGEGGMGVVFRAERVEEFGQQVALKLIAAPLGSARLRRMLMERQILAALHHPHIVTLLDGGITPGGQGYLVMEYVEGVPVTQYCREHRLGLDERLGIMRQICGAVHYAHQRGVVHRDLKPGNILVTPDGVPKVLDFGVAKLLAPDADGEDMTVTGMLRPLTPNYASPEQLRGLPVTTASDIYALGVLLYEVLAGARPYDTGSRTLDDVLRIVLEEEPARPSRALARGEETIPYEDRTLRGDLEPSC